MTKKVIMWNVSARKLGRAPLLEEGELDLGVVVADTVLEDHRVPLLHALSLPRLRHPC